MRQPEPLSTVPAAPPGTGWPVAAERECPLAAHPGAPLAHVGGGIAQLRLARPAEHNRLDPADLDAMTAWFEALAADPAVRALVITGTGERTFSSGYTLEAIVSDLDDRLERMLDTLETLPFLTIAAMNGSVYGGATDLALACDIRLGPQGSRMFMPAAKFGLHYYPGGLRRYVARLGLAAAQKLFLTAMTIDSDEMLRIGFLTEAVPAGALPARVEAYLEAALQTEPVAVREMKRHLGQVAAGRYDELTLQAATRRSLASSALRERLGKRLPKTRDAG
jgi:enoyl-CoA hydratase/carnithine racemase